MMDKRARRAAINDVAQKLQSMAARVRFLTDDDRDKETLVRAMLAINGAALILLRLRDRINEEIQAEIDAAGEVA